VEEVMNLKLHIYFRHLGHQTQKLEKKSVSISGFVKESLLLNKILLIMLKIRWVIVQGRHIQDN